MSRPDDPEEDDDLDANRFDRILVRHLTSQPHCRLFVGEDLARVNWAGVEDAFGPLLALHPEATILAVYDDSAFGRGRYGFVVTDRHLHYVQRKRSGEVALDTVRRQEAIRDGVRVTIGLHGQRTSHVDLRIDEWDALSAVQRWLRALVSVNRSAPKTTVPTAASSLTRLEGMASRGTLRPSHVERILRLAERLRKGPPSGT